MYYTMEELNVFRSRKNNENHKHVQLVRAKGLMHAAQQKVAFISNSGNQS